MSKQQETVTQVYLSTKDNETMTTWVNSDRRLKEGVWIELKGDDRLWRVCSVYATQNFNSVDNRGWDNNNYDKHTGLFK